MTKVEDLQAITARYLREGRTLSEATAEWKRQGREVLRERESAILAAAEQPGASEHLLQVAQQIRDHRDAGNYTTQGPRRGDR
jgi:hypothetical protein